MAGEIATAFVSILPSFREGASALNQQASAAGDSAGKSAGTKFSSGFGSTLKIGAAIGAAFVTTKVVGFFKESVAGASDLNETINKSNVIFGSNAAAIQKWATTAATNLGLSRAAALNAAAGFGDMFAQLGFGADEAAKLATATVGLSADLGSFNNLPTEDVAQRISAAFRGEFDSLQLLIPNINAARVQTEALAASGKTNASELTAQEKAAAVLAIVNKDGARAQGDFAKTSDALANSQKILTARWEDAKATVGQALLPAMIALTAFLSEKVVPAFVSVSEKVIAFIQTADFSGIEEGVKAIVAQFKGLDADSGLPDLSGLLDLTGRALKFVSENVDLVVKALPFLAAGFILVKTAQLAANVASSLTPALRLAEIIVNRKLTASNVQLSAAIRAQTVAVRGSAVAEGTNTVAKTGGILATARATIATTAKKVAEIAAATATRAMAAGQWLLNAALTANPIGIVVVAIAALVAGLIYAYKHSETFRKIVDGAFKAIATAGVWLWETILKPIFDIWIGYYKLLWEGAQLLWNLIKGAWEGISAATSTMKGQVEGFFNGLVAFVSGIPQRVLDFVTGLWDFISDEAEDIQQDVVKGLTTFWTWLRGLPAQLADLAGDVFGWLIDKAIAAAAAAWKAILDQFGGDPFDPGDFRPDPPAGTGGRIATPPGGGGSGERGFGSQGVGGLGSLIGQVVQNFGAGESDARGAKTLSDMTSALVGLG